MKTTHLLLCFVCLVVATEFSGCADHLNPGIPPGSVARRLRVKTITQALPGSPNTTKVSSFSYDSQGRLASILTAQAPDRTVAPVETSIYQYDAQNRLTQLRRDIVDPNNPSNPNSTETYTLSYNLINQIAELTYNGLVVRPTYNGSNQITEVTKTLAIGGLTYGERDTFTYTGDNLTYANFSGATDARGVRITAVVNTTYTYDTKINPFFGKYIIPAPGNVATSVSVVPIYTQYTYYGGFSNLLNLSPNNVISSTSDNNTRITYAYTYNASDLPASRVTTNNNAVTETLTYEYETY